MFLYQSFCGRCPTAGCASCLCNTHVKEVLGEGERVWVSKVGFTKEESVDEIADNSSSSECSSDTNTQQLDCETVTHTKVAKGTECYIDQVDVPDCSAQSEASNEDDSVFLQLMQDHETILHPMMTITLKCLPLILDSFPLS